MISAARTTEVESATFITSMFISGEQRLRPLPGIGVALAAFVEPRGEAILRFQIGGGRCTNGLWRREAALLPVEATGRLTLTSVRADTRFWSAKYQGFAGVTVSAVRQCG
jgi:hypothetical protein